MSFTLAVFMLAIFPRMQAHALKQAACDTGSSKVVAVWEGGTVRQSQEGMEGSSFLLCFRTPTGTRSAGYFEGKLLFHEKTRRIIVVGISSHFMVRETVIYAFSGDSVATIRHDELVGFGASDDQRILWLCEFAGSMDAPEGRVLVYSTDGAHLMTRNYRSAGTLRVEFDGRSYLIPLEGPRIPG